MNTIASTTSQAPSGDGPASYTVNAGRQNSRISTFW